MTRLERLELNELSKKAYGVSSRWQTILNKGLKTVVAGKASTRYPSLEEVKALMVQLTENRSDKTIEQALSDITSVTGVEIK
jgi:hypothetical protein